MLIPSILLCVFFVQLSSSADHGTFKDCSRVDFCSNLRSRSPSYDYTVNSDNVAVSSPSKLEGRLDPTNGETSLTFAITGLAQNTFRLQIAELESNRYQLTDVLDGEPQSQDFDFVGLQDTSATLTLDDNTITVNYEPFSITFSKGNNAVVFEGDRLTMSQNDATAPFSFAVTFPSATQLYGLHEHADGLALENTAPGGTDPFRLKNSDVANYEVNSPMALYGAVPTVYGHGSDGTSGVFLLNAAEQWIETTSNTDDGSRAYFMAETGSLDLFVFLGPTPKDVVQQFTVLTGVAHLPPLWTLGYHQSRYSYDTQDDVQTVAQEFDNNDFPLDAIWLDIDYSDGFKYFTWNPNTFSDPVGLQQTLNSSNKHLITIIDPHIKVENGYSVYDGALANDLFVKNADGSVFQGPCWPGTSSYMDFLNPAAREYYGDMYSYENFPGSTPVIGGIWNDMNEPSVFDTSLEMTLPADSLHINSVRHREIHNIYGFLHTMATHQGLLKRDNGSKRPFVLTRSHFAGSQRYAAFWTGDNTADWPYILASYQECLNANILGLVFCGADVGGFFQNPSNELMERWYQAGAWLPFYRAHSEKNTQRREPYLLPEDSQTILRQALQLRYRHIPTWYTLFAEHNRTGAPIIRPIFYQYPAEAEGYKVDDQVLVGRDILARAIHDAGATSADVYFPGGENELWISINGDDVQSGNGIANVAADREFSPVYYRRGGVVVTKDQVRSNTAEQADDHYTLYYTPNEDGTADGTVYLDSGDSFDYITQADYNYVSIQVAGDSITYSNIDGNGNYELVVDKIVRREIIQHPQNGKAGKYKETIFTKDAFGTLLNCIKINLKQKNVSFKLP